MRALLAIAQAIEGVLRRVADATGWLMVVLMVVIVFDVLTRKLGLQVPGVGSTRLQEFEWHLHTVIFSGWLGYNYLINAHPRVDSFTELLPIRRRAWIELIGCLIFALPYAYVCAKFGIDFVRQSYATGEGSDAVIGIPQRWIIKSFFVAGLLLLLASVVAMTLKLVVYHFGGSYAAQAKPAIVGGARAP